MRAKVSTFDRVSSNRYFLNFIYRQQPSILSIKVLYRFQGLVNNYGNERRHAYIFTSTKRGGGGGKVLAMVKGGHKRF